MGRDIKRYQVPDVHSYLILIPKGYTRVSLGAFSSNAWKVLEDKYPAIAQHLKPYEESCEKRYDKGEYWWELRACDYYREFERPKIIVPAIVQRASYTWDETGIYSNDKTSIIPTDDKYLLGLLNSSTLDFFLHKIASTKQGGYFEYKPMYVSRLPVKVIDPKNNSEAQKREEIVNSVELILSLKKDLSTTRLESSIQQLQTRIDHAEKKIDSLVYQLYDLTLEEVSMIESAAI